MRLAEFRGGNRSSNPVRIIIWLIVLLIVTAIGIYILIPEAHEIFTESGKKLIKNAEISKAIDSLNKANVKIKSNPDEEPAHLDRTKAFLVLGNIEGARVEWEKWHEDGNEEWGKIGREIQELELKTNQIRTLVHDAENSQYPSNQYPPIYALLDDLILRYTGIPKYRAMFLKGYLLLREGRKAEAQEIFSGEIQSSPVLQAYIDYNFARSLSVSGNEQIALDVFNQFLKEYPSHRLAPLAHLERINLFKDSGNLESAIQECKTALDRYPSSEFAPKALRKWAEIYEGEMDFENGAKIRLMILDRFPESEEAQSSVKMFYDGVYSIAFLPDKEKLPAAFEGRNKFSSDALSILKALLESSELTSEEKAKAAYGASVCEYVKGKYYECIQLASKAGEIAPYSEWDWKGKIRIGHAYKKLNKYDKAIESYSAVAYGKSLFAPTAAEILYEYAYDKKDLVRFRNACQQIVDQYPKSPECPKAMTWLAYIECRNGQYQAARGYAERCISAFPKNAAIPEAMFWLGRALSGLGKNSDSKKVWSELASQYPWNYWGIRAGEMVSEQIKEFESIDSLGFSTETLSLFDGKISEAWELYYSGVLDLAESEFRYADENEEKGAKAGLALVLAEQEMNRTAILAMRAQSALGDQKYLTPALQEKLIQLQYPMVFKDQVLKASLAHDVPASWLWGTMRQESTYNPKAKSGSGAIGLIQIMPETGRFIAAQRGASTFNPDVLWDPGVNLDYSAWYFSYLRSRVGDNLSDILAAYNGGPGRLSQYKNELPTRDSEIFISAIPRDETRRFAHWVYANIRMYERLLKDENF